MINQQNWTTEFFAWADTNDIAEEKLPRDAETLLSQTALNLSFCNLTQLPESLGNLTHLTELDLAYNALTEIPEWIDNFTALEKLDVSGNSITSLPDSLRHLPNLVVLGLDKQRKKEANERKNMAQNREEFQKRGKQITGYEEHLRKSVQNALKVPLKPMPLSRKFLDELVEFINDNQSIPKNVSAFKPSLFNRKTLWESRALALDNIKNVPNAVAKLTNLQFLSLANNELKEIPEWICDLPNLSQLLLPNNQLVEIPNFIFKLKKLGQLNFAFNKLTELSSDIDQLTNLYALDISSNNLSYLPESIGNLTKLEELYLEYNKFSNLPESISNCTKLNTLELSFNQFEKFPESIGKLVNLTQIGFGFNQLTELPEFVTNLKKLKRLTLTGNRLLPLENSIITLGIPASVLNMPELEIISDEVDLHKKLLEIAIKKSSEKKMKIYQQKILFGSPGTGKSYKIDKQIISKDLKITNSANVIKTVFHPEYTYGDFVGKLMPITVGGNVQYKFYEGHFLKALSQTYKNIIAAQDNDGEVEKVALVIDEINRGNSAAIFGTIFQLLDREPDGWSSYEVSVNEIIFNRLFELCDLKPHSIVQNKIKTYKFGNEEIEADELQKKLNCHFENRTIKIPPNLSILASMNTSDSSIYYMDSAFKRRWEWEFIDVDSNTISVDGEAFKNRDEWIKFVSKLNAFIKSNHKSIRGIEDKQIGHFFITDDVIQKSSIQNKLMFFLWDSVFNRDKKPLVKLLFAENTENELITFGDFAKEIDLFIEKINGYV